MADKKHSVIILLISFIFAFGLFVGDVLFPFASLSALYICLVLMSLWIDDDRVCIGTTITSAALILTAHFFPFTSNYILNSSLLINKGLSIALVIGAAFFVIQRREVETKVKRFAETLELRVLARTTAAEARSKRLEQQIQVLQIIRQNNTDNAFTALDEVIQNLRDINTTIEKDV